MWRILIIIAAVLFLLLIVGVGRWTYHMAVLRSSPSSNVMDLFVSIGLPDQDAKVIGGMTRYPVSVRVVPKVTWVGDQMTATLNGEPYEIGTPITGEGHYGFEVMVVADEVDRHGRLIYRSASKRFEITDDLHFESLVVVKEITRQDDGLVLTLLFGSSEFNLADFEFHEFSADVIVPFSFTRYIGQLAIDDTVDADAYRLYDGYGQVRIFVPDVKRGLRPPPKLLFLAGGTQKASGLYTGLRARVDFEVTEDAEAELQRQLAAQTDSST
jgi:hypothetical protein